MSETVQEDLSVRHVIFLRRFAWYKRWDVSLFAVTYAALSASYLCSTTKVIALFAFPVVMVAQLLLYLANKFSLKVRQTVGYGIASLPDATHVLITPQAGSGDIVPLQCHVEDITTSIAGHEVSLPKYFINYQKIIYHIHPTTPPTCIPQAYPENYQISDYIDWKGYSGATASVAKSIWENNEFDIPLPAYLELLLEHITAPFFVFQLICLALWSLDDYWYYSVLTFMLLLGFEGLLAKQRYNSLMMLRSLRNPPYPLCCYRDGKWMTVRSDQILPGDIISISSHRQATKQQSNEVALIPCDALLLTGSAVVNEAILTGESTPHVKESALSAEGAAYSKINVVYGGTTLLQNSDYMSVPLDKKRIVPLPPDGGCVAVALRTGFGTLQGNLMRKILYAADRVTVNSNETLYFICILLFFAIAASVYVLTTCYNDPMRNKFKIILHCIMIITSVVPPELPMELSLAVTNALNVLSKSYIFCTEPFRIIYGGKINMLCFDKTGTLTQDQMVLLGVVHAQEFPQEDVEALECQSVAVSKEQIGQVGSVIMGTCHMLVAQNNEIIGDPMEVEAFKLSGFETLDSTSLHITRMINKHHHVTCRILHHYNFTSSLQRMSVIVDYRQAPKDGSPMKNMLLVCTKGAPEVVSQYMKTVPSNYRATYMHHMLRGKRVLAMAYRILSQEEYKDRSRDAIESQLVFGGFLVYDSKLKADSKIVIHELQLTNTSIVMLTGDSVYTAADIGGKLGIIRKKTPYVVLETVDNQLVWSVMDKSNPEASASIPFDIKSIMDIQTEYGVCVSGTTLSIIETDSLKTFGMSPQQMRKILYPHVQIFARVTPQQKEKIIDTFNSLGKYTLMCGDGTNDIGALRKANIGISVINDAAFENKINSVVDKKDRVQRALMEIEQQERNPFMIKLGDASIASSFTSRRTSIDCVLNVMRQGRSALVNSIQVYKVLSLNCLLSAYTMSFLYLNGLKQGDMQMTAIGMASALLFFFISQAKPLQHLSTRHPPSSVFHRSVMMSIVGQFVVHFACLMYAVYVASDVYTIGSILPDSDFEPNIMNTTIFILSAIIQINNFVVNYRGHPFIEDITANKYLLALIVVIYCTIITLVTGAFEPLNDLLQLQLLPTMEFQRMVLAILFVDTVGAFGVEKLCQQFE